MPGRRPRHRGRRVHPGLLAAAPPPEAGRGGPRPVPDRRSRTNSSARASKAILREAGYAGAGTCEFLVGQDGTISFLEVNTRLQVEHPVTEEVTGIDLVREMFRIADGEPLGYDDPAPRGHSVEFRINAEDPGRKFLPAPGTVTTWQPPAGPGVRLDSGVQAGSVIGPAWDSLLAKLIVTGATRREALQRAARALAEFEVSGLATALPFHRAVVTDPAFAPELHGGDGPFSVHTRWIETEFRNDIPPWTTPSDTHGRRGRPAGPADPRRRSRRQAPRGHAARPSLGPGRRPARCRASRRPTARSAAGQGRGQSGAGPSGDTLTAPMQGTVIKVAVSEGQQVSAGDLIVVLEAMKMEQPVNAHKSGTVSNLARKRAPPSPAVPSSAKSPVRKDPRTDAGREPVAGLAGPAAGRGQGAFGRDGQRGDSRAQRGAHGRAGGGAASRGSPPTPGLSMSWW